MISRHQRIYLLCIKKKVEFVYQSKSRRSGMNCLVGGCTFNWLCTSPSTYAATIAPFLNCGGWWMGSGVVVVVVVVAAYVIVVGRVLFIIRIRLHSLHSSTITTPIPIDIPDHSDSH